MIITKVPFIAITISWEEIPYSSTRVVLPQDFARTHQIYNMEVREADMVARVGGVVWRDHLEEGAVLVGVEQAEDGSLVTNLMYTQRF